MDYVYYFDEWVKKIEEGLITTYDIDKAMNYVDNSIIGLNVDYKIDKKIDTDNKFFIELFDVSEIELLKNLLIIIIDPLYNKYGWFNSLIEIVFNDDTKKYVGDYNIDFILLNHHRISKLKLYFEAKFNKIVKNVPDKLYHLSIKQYKNDIMKYGLVPKSKSKIHNDSDGRIYLSDNVEMLEYLKIKMEFYYHNEKSKILMDIKNKKSIYNKNTKWVVFEIDTIKANIKYLYEDPNSDGFYYTENINPNSIKIINEEI